MSWLVKALMVVHEDGFTINPGEKEVVSDERADYLERSFAAAKIEKVEDEVIPELPNEQPQAGAGETAAAEATEAPAAPEAPAKGAKAKAAPAEESAEK